MSDDLAWLGSAWLMGLLGGTHCVGMCGGLSAAFTYALPEASRRGWRLLAWQLTYNSGRLITYTLLGLLAGLLFAGVAPDSATHLGLRLLAGLFMVLLGAYLAGWFAALAQLERIGAPLWRRLEPLRRRLLPVQHPHQALLAGMLWGFLPCGLVYSALTLALTRGDTLESGLVMLAFGLGTLPTLLLTGTAASQLKHLLQRPGTRQTAGILVILFGLWTLLGTQLHSGHDHHAHGAAEATTVPADNMSGMDHSHMDPAMHQHMMHGQ